MAAFSPAIYDFWRSPYVNGMIVGQDDSFTLIVDPGLSDDRRLTVLTADDRVTATVTADLADRLRLRGRPALSESAFRAALADAGIALHGADCLFYFAEPAKIVLMDEAAETNVRQLTAADGEVFTQFQAAASEQDLDDAYVELDHWAVFGSFDGDLLVTAASMYPWGDARIADLGVLTLPQFRGRGHARKVVRAICRYAYAHEHDPQYRCQLDNHASRALAAAAGLTLFGTWEVISADPTG